MENDRSLGGKLLHCNQNDQMECNQDFKNGFIQMDPSKLRNNCTSFGLKGYPGKPKEQGSNVQQKIL